MQQIEIIINIGRENGGYITSKELSARGISTVSLMRMEQAKEVVRLAPGVYLLNGYHVDDFYTLALRYSKAVFSRSTALYLNGLSNRQIECVELNFPLNYNNAMRVGIKAYRVNKELYSLGMMQVVTPLGHNVNSYDIERCICDMYYYDYADIEDKTFAVKTVDKRKLDYDKLFAYAKKMNVLAQVKSVFEVLS